MKFVVMIIVSISVTSCGVKSMPIAPGGAIYPEQYLPPLEPIEAVPGVLKNNNLWTPAVQDPNNFWQYPNTPPTK
jgi:hypothetical protein